MSYASTIDTHLIPIAPARLPVSAAQVRRGVTLGLQSAALALALWVCLALPGLLADGCSVTAYHARIVALR